jgi:hypothetical protein
MIITSFWKSIAVTKFCNAIRLCLFFYLIFFTESAFGQIANEKVIEVLGQSYIEEISNTNPDRIEYLNYFVEKGFYFLNEKYSVEEKYPNLSKAELNDKYVKFKRPAFNQLDFNPLKYQIKRSASFKTVYRVDNTDWIIVFYSEKDLTLNRSKKIK